MYMQESRISYLLQAYANDTCTAGEREELWQLLSQEANDGEVETALHTLIHNTPPAHHMDDTAAEDILKAILAQSPPARQRTLRPWKWMAAAACVVGIVIAGWFFSRSGKVAVPDTAMQGTGKIVPGSNQATLILDDGTSLNLGHADSTSIAMHTAAQLLADSGKLVFNKNTVPGVVHYNTIVTPAGGQYAVVLPDGSRAWLNAGSSLRFPSAFGDNKRVVEMTGEVFFDIAPGAARPFLVRVHDLEVLVLGTQFNIMAYDNEPAISATLVQGAVAVQRGLERKMPATGQQVVIKGNQPMEIQPADISRITAWKEGRFEFNGSIAAIMRQIERWYDVKVLYEGNVAGQSYIGTISRSEDIGDVLKTLELTGSLHFKVVGKQIIVTP